MGLSGATTRLYNVNAFFRATSYICICEGEIDTITLDTVCNLPAVGVPGVNNWKKHYSRNEFAKSLSRELSGLTVIHMPEGEDVNSMYRQEGPDYFKNKIASARG
jgi:DNA primase